MGLKIIGAGFGRTGTHSLKIALEELGFGPCHHMTEVFANPWQIPYWQAATEGKPVDWHTLLANYQATTDWPCCTFYEQLMQTYPDAKVLLSVRDPERWYESVTATIYRVSLMSHSPIVSLVKLINPMVRERLRSVHMVNALVWQRTFHDKFEDKAYAISVFNQHNEEVKQRVPAEKLLVFDVKEGWEPLCTFLGVAVPDKPFPHVNDRESFGGGTRNIARQQSRLLLVASGTVIAMILAFLLLVGRRKREE